LKRAFVFSAGRNGELPHRPELAAITCGMNAAFVRELAGEADVDPSLSDSV
jgi:hypothetical protein